MSRSARRAMSSSFRGKQVMRSVPNHPLQSRSHSGIPRPAFPPPPRGVRVWAVRCRSLEEEPVIGKTVRKDASDERTGLSLVGAAMLATAVGAAVAMTLVAVLRLLRHAI